MSVIGFLRSKPWMIPLCIFAILLIGGARMHELWGDEAETAIFARNILKYGVPRGWDGVNIMGINNAVVLDQHLINHTSPWAQYYLVALSFALFGKTSFTARIPSIVCSVVSLLLLFLLAQKITRSRRVAWLSMLIASVSVQGILFGYQARYYALTNAAGLLFVWSAISLEDKRIWPKILFVLAGILFYYANYVAWTAFYLATFAGCTLSVVLQKGWKKSLSYVGKFIMWTVPIVIAAVPWVIFMHPFEDRGQIQIFPLSDTISSLGVFVVDAWRPFYAYGPVPLGIVILVLIVLGVRFRSKTARASYPVLVGIPFVFLFIMGVFATIAYVDTIFSAPRYTTVMIPFLCVVVAYALETVYSWRRWVGIGLIGVYLFTNLLAFGGPVSYQALLVGELIHPYQTPEAIVAKYLTDHATKGDTAFVNLDRDYEPLMFLLGDYIRFVNRVSLINSRIFPQNRNVIARYAYDFRGEPDWVIVYSKRTVDGTMYTTDMMSLWREVDLQHDYIEHVIPVFFSDLSRPEMDFHSFTGISNPGPRDYVYIYEKKE